MSRQLKVLFNWMPLAGYKTTIGAALLVVGGVAGVLGEMAPMFPDVEWLGIVATQAGTVLEWVQKIAEIAGYSLATVGLAHKAVR